MAIFSKNPGIILADTEVELLAFVPSGDKDRTAFCLDTEARFWFNNGSWKELTPAVPTDYGFDGTITTTSSNFVQVASNIGIASIASYAKNRTQIWGIISVDVQCNPSVPGQEMSGEFDIVTITAGPQILGPVTLFSNTVFAQKQSALFQILPNKVYRIRIRKASGTGSVQIRSATLLLKFK